MPYVGSYAWKVRQKYGSALLLFPAATVIPEREDGAIMLMQNADTGAWQTIGGLAEEGASFRDTARTELREEAALEVDDADLIPFATMSDSAYTRFTYPSGDDVQLFGHCFVVRTWRQLQQPLDDEVGALRFFPIDNLPANTTKQTQKAVQLYKQYLATGEFQSY